MTALTERAAALIRELKLQPHPEGGHYREIFRSAAVVRTPRGERSALTTIDFVLARGERSAWHRVRSDEAWHLLEGGPLLLRLAPPDCSRVDTVVVDASNPRHVVPADWWQAAEPEAEADHVWVGATVGPGFEFDDFTLGRDEPAFRSAIGALAPELHRLL